jgi:myo-inositol-1(or 4)-monophosphatase
LPAAELIDNQTPEEIRDDLRLIVDAARAAGQIALSYFGKDPEVWMKEGDSPVSEADHAADKYLKETLLAARPDYGWLSEETTDDGTRVKQSRVFVVDPIDGTRGFIQGNPKWCVSVAIVEAGRPYCGVLDCPALGEVYQAGMGTGAWLNGKRITESKMASPLRISGPKPLVNHFTKISGSRIENGKFIPSLAYRLASVASGRLDGSYAKANCHDWDIAAADLIMAESGTVLSGLDGKEIIYNRQKITHGTLVAAHNLLHGQMVHAARSEQNIQEQS